MRYEKARLTIYHRHRLPARVIAEAAWQYFLFPLRFRLVEDLLTYRGFVVTHKTVCEWAEKFGWAYANTIRRRTPRPGDKWHLDECVISIKGEHHILWRAVDQDGFVLEDWVKKRRDTKAARRFMRKLVSAQGCSPRVIVTDKLGPYGAVRRELGRSICDQRQHKGLNNRRWNAHQPMRPRERTMKRFKSARHIKNHVDT